jgi:hypothetical protein
MQLQDFDTMYGHINLGRRRDSPIESEGRSPPDTRATTETSLHRNIIVKRGVDHDITASAMKNSLQKTSSSVALRNTLKPSATLAGDMVERTANSTLRLFQGQHNHSLNIGLRQIKAALITLSLS